MKINISLLLCFTAWIGFNSKFYSQFQNEGVVYSDELAEPVFYFSIDSAQCANSKDGSIILWNENEYIDSVVWENGEKSLERFELGPGNYSIQTYLNYGVIYNYDFQVASPPPLEINIYLAELKNSIQINAEVVGGIAPYSYEWSNGIGLDNFITSIPGNYYIDVTDKKGCLQSSQVMLAPMEISNSFQSNNDFQINSSEHGGFSVSINDFDFTLHCYSMNGKLVKPSTIERNQLKYNKLARGYYFLIGQIGEREFKEKVFVL